MVTFCLEAMDSFFQRRMWDDKDIEAELEEEIKAELDKISVSSLEIRDETDSSSEAGSESDPGEEDLPESVLYCINVIKNRSKNAENLVLQDLEDTDFSSPSCGATSNSPTDFMDELISNYHENALELKKRMLFEIEKELQINSTYDKIPNSAQLPNLCNLPVDEPLSSDDTDTISFGYYEVEERCRQSFAAWEDKQRELENQENEKFRAQRDREEKQLQEEEEKRHCRMKQFEMEKEKIENIHKQEEEKINVELQQQQKLWEENLKAHEEFIRRLQLQVEEERRCLEDLKAKERQRLADLQHKAAIKIQARYRTFVAYKKYGSIIKERLNNKKKKKEMLEKQKQEWKEMADKIRQKDEERKKKVEQRLKKQEEIKYQRQKEQEKRQEEYEKKKKILKLNKEQKLMEEVKKREEVSAELVMKKENEKREDLVVKKENKKNEEWAKELLVKKENKKENVSKDISVKFFTKKKDMSIKPSVKEEFNEKENITKHITPENKLKNIDIAEQELMQKLKQEPLGENISRKLVITEFKKEQNENLGKHQKLVELQKEKKPNESLAKGFIEPEKKKNKTNYLELEQEREKGSSVDENKGNKCQEAREDKEMRNNLEQNGNKQNQEEEDSKIIKEEKEKEKNGESHEKENHFSAALNHVLSILKAGSNENAISYVSVMTPAKKSEFQAIDNDESSETNTLADGETIILNTSDIVLNVESNSCKKKSVLFQPTSYNFTGDSDKNSSVSEETTSAPSVMSEIPRKFCEFGTESKSITAHSLSKITVLIEEKRLAWTKTCRPWFQIFGENQRKKVVKRNRPRKCSVSKLPPLNSVAILQGGLWSTLQQVTTVTFQDLPGCSLCTLSECTSLQFLTLKHCGLTALEGLNNCKKLKYIDVQENQIQVINCENLENLCILLLNDNELTSFHGLDGCSNLRKIDVSNNKITRIGGLESLKSLQQLIVDHNQLISTRGLCSVPTIMYLDCSYNNLTKVEGVKDCGLLQILKLQGNYLTEFPSLENQVLLRELYLDDNSISTLEIVSSYWLPLLQILTVSQNSLTEIVPLFQFISLEKLDVSNNCLSDLTGVTKCFHECSNLRDLSLVGNPLLQERNWRQSILELLPTLRILNGETLKSDSPNHETSVPETGSFSAICQTQTQEFNLLFKKYVTEKRNIHSLDAIEDLCCYFNELMRLSSLYRDVHEHGDFRITERDKDLSNMKRDQSEEQQDNSKQAASNSLQQNNLFLTGIDENKQDFLEASQKRIDPDNIESGFIASPIHEHIEKMNQDQRVPRRRKDIVSTKTHTKNSSVTEELLIKSEMEKDFQHVQNDANNSKVAPVIQSHCQGSIIHRQIKEDVAATIIQRSWRNYLTRTQMKKGKCSSTDMHTQREKAATLIQAVWKGFLLRKKLTRALASIKNEELEDDYGEINLDDFTFDEAALEKEWFSLDSTNFPSKTQSLPNELHQPKYSGYLSSDDTSLNLPYHPDQAWQCSERENPFSPEDSQFTDRSESQKLSSSADFKSSRAMKMSLRSKKEEKISEEWGFKDISTAQLMLKRAQKMKSKKTRHKLDPAVRLALFKNNGNKQPPVKPAKKAGHARQGYFEVDEEELANADVLISSEKIERSKELTYQWLHTQVGSYETTCPRNVKCQTHFLPVLDPDVLNGGRVQLVEHFLLPNNPESKEAFFESLHFHKEGDQPTFGTQKTLNGLWQKCKHFTHNARLVRRGDMDVDLVSMNSGSALAQNREKNHQASRHSAESSFKVITVPGIRNAKKKWVSHRDYPVQFSDGWESGKRKAKTFN
ncbi:leucine-rich repeat and IQ domain-containing protein 1 [Dromiciops gliroides]|uniref:leucine-rich repeat and IQ domain-containing protein 1 n=1 Tax=Dromiciops gliroides TaxID=33562 RepID=UPI001CC5F2DE|nr:leucine-rich repeat and IQ domain-containing protein 1 [Dromiciops gliroides]